MIETQGGFDELLDEWKGVERYALDTEFHKKKQRNEKKSKKEKEIK